MSVDRSSKTVKQTANGITVIQNLNKVIIHENDVTENNSKDVNVELKRCNECQNTYRTNSEDGNTEQGQKTSRTHTFIRMQLLQEYFSYTNNSDKFTDEQDKEVLQLFQDLITKMEQYGLSLKSLTPGYLVLNLSVQHSYALENLIECHTSGEFILELAKVFGRDLDEVKRINECWSIHIDEQTYTKTILELQDIENSKSVAEWNRGDVRKWLISELKFDKERANKFYQEEMIMRNLIYSDIKEIEQDFALDGLHSRVLEFGIENKIRTLETTLEIKNLVTTNCTPSEVSHLLSEICIAPIHTGKFTNLKISGKKFIAYKLKDLRHNLNLPIGPFRLIAHLQMLSNEAPKTSKISQDQSSANSAQQRQEERLASVQEHDDTVTLVNKLFFNDKNIPFHDLFSPILVLNEPNERIKSDKIDKWFRFISEMKWLAVFDFDASSLETGIGKLHSSSFKKVNSDEISLSQIFNEHDTIEEHEWIFCNGRVDTEDNAMKRRAWIKDRSFYMDNAIKYVLNANYIRKGKELVVFLILSSNLDVMVEGFREFYRTFFGLDHFVFVCESHTLFNEWCNKIDFCTSTLHEKAIIGAAWENFSSVIMKTQNENINSPYILPTVDDKCRLSKSDLSKWTDFTVIASNQCENNIINNQDDFIKFQELEFYRGKKPSFWNFKLTDDGYDHLCPRKVKRDLQTEVNKIIKSKKPLVTRLHLHHQPGAGGSTASMHVLWEFRKQCRCIILKQVTDETVSQIFEMWNYGESESKKCVPLIILSDNLNHDDLKESIYNRIKFSPRRICIIINCKRSTYLSDNSSNETTFTVVHSLDYNERKWFERKYLELEKKEDKDYKPDRLLGFMVMKEEANEEYIEQTVNGVLTDFKSGDQKHLELLQYVSLFSRYHFDSLVPVSCCDNFMEPESNSRMRRSAWEYCRPEPSLLLMITAPMNKYNSNDYGLKIVHPKIADVILQGALKSQTLANLVENYLDSALIAKHSGRKQYLERVTKDLLIQRRYTDLKQKATKGTKNKPDFSGLILAILKFDKRDGLRVLQKGYYILKDPMILQQVARYNMYVFQEFAKAAESIKDAIDAIPGNSYLLDTNGQIYKNEIWHYYSHYMLDGEIEIETSLKIIDSTFKTISCFQHSEYVSMMNKKYNTSSVSGVADTIFKSLFILRSTSFFRQASDANQTLTRYLVDDTYKPKILEGWTSRGVKQMRQHLTDAMDTMSNFLTFLDDNFNRKTGLSTKYNEYMEYWKELFHSKSPLTCDETNVTRRINARNYGTYHLEFVFDLSVSGSVQALVNIVESLKKNYPYNSFDYNCILIANLALSAVGNRNNYSLPSLDQMVEMTKEYLCQQPEYLFPPYFLVMFLWKRKEDGNCDTDDLFRYIALLQTNWKKFKDQIQGNVKRHSPHPVYGRFQDDSKNSNTIVPSVQFFLGQPLGLRGLLHRSKLKDEDGRINIYNFSHMLVKYEGVLNNNFKVKTLFNEREMSIPFHKSDYVEHQIGKVYFYIGFSWSGPVAYIIPDTFPSRHAETSNTCSAPARFTESKTVTRIKELQERYTVYNKRLAEIKILDKKREKGQFLEEKYQKMLEKREEIKTEMQNIEAKFNRLMGNYQEEEY